MDLGIARELAVVTGGASGIGLAVARAFVAEGARVALWDLSESVATVAKSIQPEDSNTTFGVPVDITDPNAVQAALRSTVDRFGAVSHLVHCAATGSGKFGFPYTELSPDDWRRVLEVNVMGLVQVAHVLGPHMRQQSYGSMAFIASVAGQIGSQTDPPYSASKAATINFAQCVAKDLAPHGVRVNAVCPGMVKTPLNEAVWRSWHDRQSAGAQQTYDEWAEDKIRTLIPLAKWQSAADIADTVVFLASKRAAQITGQTINVDGGYVMHW